MSVLIWHTVATCFLVCIWFSALKKAHRMHVFDKSVGLFTVYVWHGVVPMFWTVIILLISFAVS